MTAATLVFEDFTVDDSWALGELMRGNARLHDLPICITISKPSGTTLFHASLPGATVDNDDWAKRKAAVSHRFETSSAEFGSLHEQVREHPLLASWIDLDRYAPVGGAVPIRVNGVGVVAVVAVSGLPGDEDHEFVEASLAEYAAGKQRR